MKITPLLICLAAASLSILPAAGAAPDFSDSQAYPVLAQAGPAAGSGLYLDRKSIRVADIAGEDMILTADILSPLPDGTAAVKTVTYKLDAAGKESIRGTDGTWQALPENSDDPAAVGAMLVRNELGREERREEFLNEIQQILLNKKKETAETPPAAQEETSAAPSPGESVPSAPAVIPTAAVSPKEPASVKGEEKAPAAPQGEAHKGASPETPAPPEQENTPPEEKSPPKEEPPQEKPKDTPPPPVVVDIQSHEPQVQIEVTKQ